MTQKILILRGVPASGKTTFSKAWVAEDPEHHARVNRDDLRYSMFTKYSGLSFEQEALVTDVEHLAVQKLVKAGKSVVIDAMGLRPKYVREWLKFADRNKVDVEIVEFPISLEAAIERDSQREKAVGESVLRTIWNKYTKNGKFLPVEYTPTIDSSDYELYVPDDLKLKAIIIDIDGTIAHNDGHRGWYEYDKVGNDKPKKPVIAVVEAMVAAGFYPIFCSGRTDDCYTETKAWIGKNVSFPVETLLMRKSGDHRKDSTVKYEIFNEHIRDNYNVVVALDDRRQVTEMWRSIGLTVLQCEFGDY